MALQVRVAHIFERSQNFHTSKSHNFAAIVKFLYSKSSNKKNVNNMETAYVILGVIVVKRGFKVNQNNQY